MKKILALLLTFVMVSSFAACSNNAGKDDVRGEQTVNNNSSTDSNAEFSLGGIDGLTYENKFIGLGCTLDSSWSFYSDEQIKEINNIAADLGGEELEKAFKNATMVYDMYAVSGNQMDNINVNLEKVNAVTLAALDIAENFEKLFPTMKQTLENMEYTDISHEIGNVEIDGKKFASMNTTAQINGIKMYQTVFAVKCNGYLANITITTFNENTNDLIIDKFYVVK